jgi:hypothetical protein
VSVSIPIGAFSAAVTPAIAVVLLALGTVVVLSIALN